MSNLPELLGRGADLVGRKRERHVFEQLLAAVRAGKSRVLVVFGEPGVGKSALLEYLVAQASGCRVGRAAGVQSEIELPFSGLHQLVAPMLDRLDSIPVPQRDALRTAFGMCPGSAPDRFLVGLGVLGLLSDAAEKQPLICVVDDQRWLDRVSAQVLAFVARRLEAEAVGMVFAARSASDDLAGLPELMVQGLRESDALVLLESAVTGPLDAGVRDRIVAETRGNPLALLELPRGLTPAELAGGFAVPGAVTLSGRIEASFLRRLKMLPAETRCLLQIAAAEPLGDPSLLWRAAERLAIEPEAATPAVEAGLVEFGTRVLFRHPIVRSVVYRSATPQELRAVHGILAEVSDPEIDPDRRAWHRAQAVAGPDETAAEELERSAGRARARGGSAAAAAFLERSAILTPDPVLRTQRLLAAANATRDVGALDKALGLLTSAEAGPLDAIQGAEVEFLRGQIALVDGRGSDAPRLLLGAARRFEGVNANLARVAHLEALGVAMWAGDLDDNTHRVVEAAQAARAAPAGADPPRVVDVMLNALALRLTEGYAAAASTMMRALELVVASGFADNEIDHWLTGGREGTIVALDLWDIETALSVAARLAQSVRDTGALVRLQFALDNLTWTHLATGEFASAELMIEENRLIGEATGNPPLGNGAMTLAAWRGQEALASELIEATLREAIARGLGRTVDYAIYSRSLLSNGLGRYDTARDAASRVFQHDQLGYGPFVLPELAEAASRTGDVVLLKTALDWLAERTRATPSAWVLGMEARVRALLSAGDTADILYRESIAHLGRTRVRPELARAHLLYGEWLRRERRPSDAHAQLRMAYEMLDSMGIQAFSDRARHELLATGETVRKRNVEARKELTAQETQIAWLAHDGLSNPEIGARLFISPRTVQYHLRKVFTKLGIHSRSALNQALPGDPAAVPPA